MAQRNLRKRLENPGTLAGVFGHCRDRVLVFFMRKHFGHGGLIGLLRALVAGLWVLFLAGILTGTLNMPLWGTTFGVIIIAATLVKSPFVAASAVIALALIHWLCRPWQIERRSIFGFGETDY